MKGSKKRKYDHENATFLSRTCLEKKVKKSQHADTDSQEDAVESTSSNTISDTDPFLKLSSDLVPVVVDDMRDRLGHRLISIDKLKDVVRDRFCCKQCNNRVAKQHIKEFLMYADEMYLMKKKEVDKMSNLKAQVRELKNLKKPSMLYKSFVGKKAKCNKAYKLGVPVGIKMSSQLAGQLSLILSVTQRGILVIRTATSITAQWHQSKSMGKIQQCMQVTC